MDISTILPILAVVLVVFIVLTGIRMLFRLIIIMVVVGLILAYCDRQGGMAAPPTGQHSAP